ncbi:DUF2290 domain-containing protein [Bacillus safensis]|uniref:DUF2290 domain-containing protein n=1 Tax=Bacillus safensis TaxID=561879 RepID=UPI002B254014|nr:DUF2290 domain-containing protein [Bacillus safensis]MEB2270077.1 DUF2290 domain-containing protein [Bacillus safensis]
MNNGAIVDGISRGKKLLKKANIEFTTNTMFPTDNLAPNKFSEDFFRISQEKDYDKIHRTALENGDYDIILDDYSLFQFSKDYTGAIRYAYYQSSRDIITYEEFMEEFGFVDGDYLLYPSDEKPFYRDYEQLIGEAKISNSVTPIRYDYSPDQYLGITHPASHLHIGHENQIRIPIKMILSPQAFMGFVVRHIYYKKWRKAMVNDNYLQEYLSVKRTCISLDSNYFKQDEVSDLHLV